MKLEPIVKSLLDTDLYKFNMNQVIFHKHTNLNGEYHFKCRNENIIFTNEMLEEINQQIDYLCNLRFTNEELDYLRTIRFLSHDYIEFLRLYHPIRDYVATSLNNGILSIIVKGPLFSAMQFEIYLLEIVNEVYFKFQYNYQELLDIAKKKLSLKIENFQNNKYTFKFAEFGCRRRLSFEFEEYAIKEFLAKTNNLIGTSNVYLAKKYQIKPIGTYAHEYVQMYQGISKIPLAYTNYYAMKDWFDEYKGDNGIALTDTLTTDLFLLDFNFLQASTYTGLRHDSGDPYLWGNKILAHYEKLGINPKNKTLLFSDSLNFDKAQDIFNYFNSKCRVSFGIGTYVSNDTNVEPLNIVIKLQYVNEKPVAKISDCKTKSMCSDNEYLKYLMNAVDFRLKRG